MQQDPQIIPYQENLLKFDFTCEELEKLGDEIIAKHKSQEDHFANLPIEQWTRQTILELNDSDMEFGTQYANIYLPTYVYTDKEIRQKATEVKNKIDAYEVESSLREDMFQILKKFQEKMNNDPNKLGLTAAEQRFVDKSIISYKRSGLDLPKEKKTRIEALQKELNELKTKFQKNLNEDTAKNSFKKAELEGMDESFLESLEKDGEDKYFVSLKYPELIPVLQKCKVAETRKKMDFLNGNKGGSENVELFDKALALKQEKATILGYDTFSDFILEIRMAKNKETVLNFIQDLRDKLVPYGEKELVTLLELKKKDCEKTGQEFNGKINSWDFGYYNTMLLDTEYQLDHDKIKEYFPIEKVTEGMFQIYQKILGVRFEPIKDFKSWHEDVTCTAVYDSQTNSFLGHFYLDMHPRDGKYGHACVIGLQRAGNKADGSRQQPACAMVCNFTKPTKDKPSLLKHDEVETFFHEFGHVMHNICTEATIHNQSCTLVQRDFVEAPSQMLENWTYEEEPLNMMSGHYQDLSKPLPQEYLKSIVAAKNVNTGLLNLRQLFFGTFDMTVHTSKEKFNTEELWAKLRKEVTLIDQQPGTNPTGGFGHIMGGYESGYYGYLWSQVYSADMFEGGFKGDCLSAEHGMRYRKCILAPGGSLDGIDLIKNFLGREPTQTSFLKNIGVLNGNPKL